MNEDMTVEQFRYTPFWTRAGAYLLDTIILSVVAITVNYVNISNFKSFLLYLPFAILAILYKPFLESYYGATIGKMIVKIKVTDKNFKKIDMTTSILRSSILVIPLIMYIPIYYLAFNNTSLYEINEFMEFSTAIATEYPMQGIIGNLSMIIIVADIIFLLSDSTKTKRSLHDRIANTYVIYDKKNKNTLGNNV
ncbi:RDD family protein [Algibacter mikhailovii]|uniref:RDD domain-containing protein n=1 Tax=Algibacter mikhailovii TaxID=425498 RepID=A0A918RE09_9FLAO|nr:RDD family protein [Algibacter mikhailovii]GGZ94365.1 hypothetical protein GCM10007028_35890 [Algibacter mikhailovii]